MSLINIRDIEIYTKTSIESSPSSSSAEYELYNFLISAVSKKIESHCFRKFEAQDYTERTHGTNDDWIMTKQYPIISVSSVIYYGDPVGTITSTVSLDDIYIDEEKGYIYNSNIYYLGRYNYEISYRAGYEEIPDDLKLICLEMVIEAYNSTTQNHNIRSERLGDYEYTLSSSIEINENIRKRLTNYVKYDSL
jgi:hypothetical protein